MSDFTPLRSVLYMPSSNERALEKAKSIACDALILDLEDAVAPDAKSSAREAAAAAPVPVIVSTAAIEEFGAAESFDAVVCSLVLCSVDDPDSVVRQLYSMLTPGGELRYLEHVAGVGVRATLQKVADATVWPRLLGNCHTHRNTEATIAAAGFSVDGSRREQTLPGWLPVPVSEFAIGRAVRP